MGEKTELKEALIAAFLPKCMAFGPGNVPRMVAAEFADAAMSVLSAQPTPQDQGSLPDGWRPEDVELMREAIEDCRPWGSRHDYAGTKSMIAKMDLLKNKPDIRSAYHARNEQVERILTLLPSVHAEKG